MVKSPLFVTFEGGEGAGKTTLIERLAIELRAQGEKVLVTREPGGTPLGEEVRRLLLHSSDLSPYAELSLFLASRAQHIVDVIWPALEEGTTVLCDRFNDSTIAYQGAARGLGVEEVAAYCTFISQGLQPDLTLYLDLDPQIGFKRIQRSKDRIETEALEFHQKIREAFLALARLHPKRLRVLDASQAPEAVFAQAKSLIDHA